MTYSDLLTHLDRLEDVRNEVVDQGDIPSPELEDRLRRVRALIAAVQQRRRKSVPPATEQAHCDTPLEIELDVQA